MEKMKTIETRFIAGDEVWYYEKPRSEKSTLLDCIQKTKVKGVEQVIDQYSHTVSKHYKLSSYYNSNDYKNDSDICGSMEEAIAKWHATYLREIEYIKNSFVREQEKKNQEQVNNTWRLLRENPDVYKEVYLLFEADYKAKNPPEIKVVDKTKSASHKIIDAVECLKCGECNGTGSLGVIEVCNECGGSGFNEEWVFNSFVEQFMDKPEN